MNLKLLGTVFGTVFLAEIGDKTQLATFFYAADQPGSKLSVFSGSALALVLSSAIAVFAGALVSKHVDPKVLSWVAGLGFVIVGVWTIVRGYR